LEQRLSGPFRTIILRVPEWEVDFGELTALGRLATRNAPCLLSIRPRQEPHRELAIKKTERTET
jgi:hypothetical protein